MHLHTFTNADVPSSTKMHWMIRYVHLFLETYFLEDSPELLHYLSQSGCVKDRSLDDKQLLDDVMVQTI